MAKNDVIARLTDAANENPALADVLIDSINVIIELKSACKQMLDAFESSRTRLNGQEFVAKERLRAVLEGKLTMLPKEVVGSLEATLTALNGCRFDLPAVGDIALRQSVNRACHEIARLLEENKGAS